MTALFLKLSDLRKGVQVLGFVVLNLGFTAALKTGIVCPALFCYACPLAMFACPFGTLQHFVVLAAVPLLAGGTIGLYATLLGRAFCGWFCPFGAFPYVFMENPSPIPFGIWVHVATFLLVVFGVLVVERV